MSLKFLFLLGFITKQGIFFSSVSIVQETSENEVRNLESIDLFYTIIRLSELAHKQASSSYLKSETKKAMVDFQEGFEKLVEPLLNRLRNTNDKDACLQLGLQAVLNGIKAAISISQMDCENLPPAHLLTELILSQYNFLEFIFHKGTSPN